MVKGKKHKRRVRALAKKTGQSYAATRQRATQAASARPWATGGYNQRHQEYRDQTLPQWGAALNSARALVGPQPTDDPALIEKALRLLPSDLGHLFYPTGGGMNVLGVTRSPTVPGALAVQLSQKSFDLLRPHRLEIRTYPNPDWSYIWLESKELGVEGLLPGDRLREEVCEISAGQYEERSVWDENSLGYDQDGYEIPLPESARLVTRYLQPSKFVVFANSSTYNSLPETYGGYHAKRSR